MTDSFVSNSIQETKIFATKIAKLLVKGDVLLLNGELGSGKTTLSKTIISSLTGIGEQNITSPTFNIIKEYELDNKTSVIHSDLYNIKTIEKVYDIGLLDFFENNITIIEWPDIIKCDIDQYYEINLFVDKNNSRKFHLNERLQLSIL